VADPLTLLVMRTYREVLGVAEFRGLFTGNALSVAGLTMQQLALSTLVYARTGSPLLAAVAYLSGFLPQAVGAATLMSLADRLPPRGFLACWNGVRAAAALTLALGGLPVWAMIALVMAIGLVDAVAAAVSTSLVAEVLGQAGYVLGRSLLNITVGAMQILGFGMGGALLAALGPRSALLAAAGLVSSTSLVLWVSLRSRAPKAHGRASLATTSRGNRRLLGDRLTRTLLLASWIPNGLIVGAEALYVPYAGDAAGALFVAAALGMLTGDVAIGRWVPATRRSTLVLPLLVLLAVPYLTFVLSPVPWTAALIVAVASVGFSASLALQERLLAAVSEQLRGQALGLLGSGMMTMQALAAGLTGLTAELTSPALAMACAAGASLVVTVSLAPRLHRPAASPDPRAPDSRDPNQPQHHG
jgi:MFS family permease